MMNPKFEYKPPYTLSETAVSLIADIAAALERAETVVVNVVNCVAGVAIGMHRRSGRFVQPVAAQIIEASEIVQPIAGQSVPSVLLSANIRQSCRIKGKWMRLLLQRVDDNELIRRIDAAKEAVSLYAAGVSVAVARALDMTADGAALDRTRMGRGVGILSDSVG